MIHSWMETGLRLWPCSIAWRTISVLVGSSSALPPAPADSAAPGVVPSGGCFLGRGMAVAPLAAWKCTDHSAESFRERGWGFFWLAGLRAASAVAASSDFATDGGAAGVVTLALAWTGAAGDAGNSVL